MVVKKHFIIEQIDKWQWSLFVIFVGLSNNQRKMALCYVYQQIVIWFNRWFNPFLNRLNIIFVPV